MNSLIKRIIYIILALCIVGGSAEISTFDTSAKARTSQSSKKKSKKKRKGKKNRKSKKSSSRKGKKSRKSSKKTTYRNRMSRTSSHRAPAPEVVMSDSLTLAVNEGVLKWIPEKLNPGGLRVNAVKPDTLKRMTNVSLNENFTYLPVTQEFISSLSREVKRLLPEPFDNYPVTLTANRHPLAYYITHVDKLPAEHRKNIPFVVPAEPWTHPSKGMEGDIIGLWSSHGRYFKGGAWQWQRPVLFETIEDIYTMGYVLPYLVPMLENAGAYVMLPRERDLNSEEVIVDNDTNEGGEIYSQPYYKEKTGSAKWTTGETDGFIYDLPDFRDTENPFENGTYRQTTTTRSASNPSVAAWYADIPKDGEYAVYVSYKSLPESTTDAHYTVNYSGGSKEFRVNQTMGGGTWIYLGTFPLEAGYSDTEPVVTLTNLSDKASGKIVTADAVKIGGGMGNIARSPHRSDIYYDPSTPVDEKAPADDEEEDDEEETEEDTTESGDETTDEDVDAGDKSNEQPQSTLIPADPTVTGDYGYSSSRRSAPVFRTSGMPRYLEGARYWLQWAGAPESVYSPYEGTNDYKDDYTSRGNWINWLAGGSRVLPGRDGLNIPVDLVMALHSDAGKRADDSIVGTLGIYYTNGGDSYADGTPRINSRMLTDLLMRQIIGDIRKIYEPAWTRRSMWDKSYVEARVPEVPTTLIELMSHQNFADMQYGLDPGFRFTVGRAIYKAMARFMGERKGREVVIQPLPVKNFAITRKKGSHYHLSWEPQSDKLEPTAMPDKYIILERAADELGFHKIGETKNLHFDVKTSDTEIHSFRIIAANAGGVSFPSETLAFREGENDREEPVLIINGFTRVSGPAHFYEGGNAGFRSEDDFGVPYINDISFSGHQMVFSRGAGESFGRSAQNYASKVIAGNTFDYPYVHGKAVADAGLGFVSCSVGAVEAGTVKLSKYDVVDLILGKQKATTVGKGYSGVKYRTIPEELQKHLRAFTSKGGHLIVSGQYVVSDLLDSKSTPADSIFAAEVLGVTAGSATTSRGGRLESTLGGNTQHYDYSNTLNEDTYIVELPDALAPADLSDADVVLRLSDNYTPVGVVGPSGKGACAVFSVPFEVIGTDSDRSQLMKQILEALKRK